MKALRLVYDTLVRWLVNMKFAVTWLLLMGGFAVYGTVFLSGPESMAFFRQPLFSAVLLVFALSLILAVLSRYPWKKHHIGWILTHAGLVVIVAGHILTYRGGVEGFVSLLEGESTGVMEQALPGGSLLWELRGQVPARGVDRAVTLLPDDLARTPDMPISKGPFDFGGVKVEVQRYVPTLAMRARIEPDFSPGPPDPAYRIEITDGRVTRASWVLADESRGTMTLGDVLTCRYLVVPDTAARDRLLGRGEPDEQGRTQALGALVWDDGRLGVATLLDGFVPLGDSGIEAKVLRRFSRLRIVDGQPVDVDSGALNEAIELALRDADGHAETIWLFAQLPQFDMAPEHMKLPFSLRFESAGAHAAGSLLPSSVTLIHVMPAGVTASADPADADAVVALCDPGGEVTSFPLELGKPFELRWIGPSMRATITDRWDRVRRIPEPVCASYEPRRPGLFVKLWDGSGEASGWVAWNPRNLPSTFTLPGAGDVALRYGPRQLALGFDLELLDFVLDTYEGTEQPKSFSSFVRTSDHAVTTSRAPHAAPLPGAEPADVVVDRADGFGIGQLVRVGTPEAFYYGVVRGRGSRGHGEAVLRIERYAKTPGPLRARQEVPAGTPVLAIEHIYMNHPLVHRGFTFFQSSYDPRTLKRSTFQVSWDPGWKTVYVGYALTVLGLLFVVWIKPIVLRREAQRRAQRALERRRREREAAGEEGEPAHGEARAVDAREVTA